MAQSQVSEVALKYMIEDDSVKQTNRYKSYPEYKDSGVEVIGSIPKSWTTTKLAYCFTKSNAGEVIDKSYWGDGREVLYTCNREPLSSDYQGFPIWKRTTEKDLLLTRNGTPYVHKPVSNAIYSNVVQRITLKNEFDRDFLAFCLSNSALSMKGYGVSIESLNFENWKSIQFTYPNIEEQIKVAEFLCYETKRIDTLIQKQQRLIELLTEKRQAVISHAVTRGLKPDVPMKESGVEWLGEVPVHWEIKPLRYIGSTQNGINIGAEAFGSGYPFVSYGDVYKNIELPIKVEGLVQSSDKDRISYSVKRGDILFTRTSETIDEIGMASTCLMEIDNATFAGFLIRFRPLNNRLYPAFSKYYFRSSKLRFFFVNEMNIVTRASLSQELLKKLPVLLPPISEQKEIAEKLSQQDTAFKKLIDKAEQGIQLMQERRTALISAAVTGKIDVRDWEGIDQ